MGDLMHALPALSDARKVFPDIRFDWVVDEAFAEVPSWHPAVNTIFKSAHRRWRKNFMATFSRGEFSAFYQQLNESNYDIVIDAQNNVKSAFISYLRKGPIHGMDKSSVAEQPAYLAYKYRYKIEKGQHAIQRQRKLFAEALGYEVPGSPIDYGIREDAFAMNQRQISGPYLFLVHNASWSTKLWPEAKWHELIRLANNEGYKVVLPGGSREELDRAEKIAQAHADAIALPRMSLSELGGIIKQAAGAFCCDTGLAHLTAMIGTPAITMYGPTSKQLIGTSGLNQEQLVASAPPFSCAPCYKRSCNFNSKAAAMSACMEAFSPAQAWEQLKKLMAK